MFYNTGTWEKRANGDNLKVAWPKFSTLSNAVFVMSEISWHGQAHPHLELKTLPRFSPVSFNLSKVLFYFQGITTDIVVFRERYWF
jgi:hypothetical protein